MAKAKGKYSTNRSVNRQITAAIAAREAASRSASGSVTLQDMRVGDIVKFVYHDKARQGRFVLNAPDKRLVDGSDIVFDNGNGIGFTVKLYVNGNEFGYENLENFPRSFLTDKCTELTFHRSDDIVAQRIRAGEADLS